MIERSSPQIFRQLKLVCFLEMESAEVNVALLKPATQSSTFEAVGTYGAAFATDGLVLQLQNGYWCTHTRREFNPWLRIDLGYTFEIKKVVLVNRQDEHGKVFGKIKLVTIQKIILVCFAAPFYQQTMHVDVMIKNSE